MRDTLLILSILLSIYIVAVGTSFWFGYVMGAGLLWIGLTVNPIVCGWCFVVLTTLSYTAIVLNGIRR